MKSSVSHGRACSYARSIVRLPVLALLVGLSLPLLTGCPGALEGKWPQPITGTGTGGTGGGGTGTGGTVGCDAETEWLKNSTKKNASGVATGCASAGCHAAGGFLPNLTTDPWGAMFGVNATQGTCVGMPMIGPSKPASGTLFKRLSSGDCGFQMPFGAAPPTDQGAVDCITAWANSKLP
jgi:hypothetical protein